MLNKKIKIKENLEIPVIILKKEFYSINNISEIEDSDIEINPNIYEMIYNNETKHIILGTMPPKNAYLNNSCFSYYDSESNLCWKIFNDIFNEDLRWKGYDKKRDFLLAKNIGMIDIVIATKRKKDSSADSELDPLILLDINKLLYNKNLKILASKGIYDKFSKYINMDYKIIPSFSKLGYLNSDWKNYESVKNYFQDLFSIYKN